MKRRRGAVIIFVVVLLLSMGVGPYAISALGSNPPGSEGEVIQAYDHPEPRFPGTGNEETVEGSLASGEEGALGLSHLSEGYVTAQCISGRLAVLLLEKEEQRYTAVVAGDGIPEVFPLPFGSGLYTLTLGLLLEGDMYDILIKTNVEADIPVPEQSFLMPNYMVDYNPESEFVAFARDLGKDWEGERGVAEGLMQWMQTQITYDGTLMEDGRGSAEESGISYVPMLERIMTEQTGLCGDYAVFYAAVLRINGVPCQVVHGTVQMPSGKEQYHAWNLAWLPNEAGEYSWVHFDPTFHYSDNPDERNALGISGAGNYRYGEAQYRG